MTAALISPRSVHSVWQRTHIDPVAGDTGVIVDGDTLGRVVAAIMAYLGVAPLPASTPAGAAPKH